MKKTILTGALIVAAASVAFPQTTLLTQGFEGASFPPAGWHVKNLGSNPAGETWMRSTTTPHSGAGCAFSQDGLSGETMNEWLVTPAMAVPASNNAVLSLWHRLQWNTYSDGPEYIVISKTDTAVTSFTDTVFTLPGTTPAAWESLAIDLVGAYAGMTIYIAFVHTSPNGYADAWVLDDVNFIATPAATHDVGTGDIVSPPALVWRDSAVTPAAAIVNYGTAAETGFYVRCRVKSPSGGVVYSDSVLYGGSLPAGGSDTVYFAEWTPMAAETDTVIVTTLLTGDADPANDSKTGLVEVTAHLHTGGPDAFGYCWIDSDTVGGPAYDWMDAASGTVVGSGDNERFLIPIGFPFTFYGHTYDSVTVGTNGLLGFSDSSENTGAVVPFNSAIPSVGAPNNCLYPFWDDLDVYGGEGNVYYLLQGTFPNRQAVIQWENVRRSGVTGDWLSFETILHENGEIVYQYQDVSVGNPAYDGGASATVGIEDKDGVVGLQYMANSAPLGNLLRDSLAVRYFLGVDNQPPGFSHTPKTNTFELSPQIQIQIADASPITADSLYFDVGGGYDPVARDSVVGNTYYYHVPEQAPGTVVQYYFTAADTAGNRGTMPAGAPAAYYTFKVLPDPAIDMLFIYSSAQDYQNKERPVWFQALDSAGFTYDIFDYKAGPAGLSTYRDIFVAQNSAGAGPEDNLIADSLISYLLTGTEAVPKNLFMAGDDIAYAQYGYANGTPILELCVRYLHAQYSLCPDGIDNNTSTYNYSRIYGDLGEPISGGGFLHVNANSPDVIHPARAFWNPGDTCAYDTSYVVYKFWPGDYAANWPCGLKYANPAYRSFFISFDLSQLDSMDQARDLLVNAKAWMDTAEAWGAPLGVAGHATPLRVRAFGLEQSRPNPFRTSTTINYGLPAAGPVKITVYNVAGQKVKSLVHEIKPAGSHSIKWNGRDEQGRQIAAGVYIYRLDSGQYSAVKKLTVIR